MLGYRGRSHRRDFIGGLALLSIGPVAFSMSVVPLIRPLIGSMNTDLGAVVMGLGLTLVVLAVAVAWVWGLSVLLVRRARDIGWPGWTGLAGAAVFLIAGIIVSPLVFYAWFAGLAVWPGPTSRRSVRLERAAVFD